MMQTSNGTRVLFQSVVLAVMLSVAATSSLAADNDYEQIAGSYHGEVFNGADLDPVVTTFRFAASGRLVGDYVVDEENGAYSGTISNVVFEGPRTITLEWTDKFGEGFAVMEFARDYRTFAGEWTNRDGTNPHPWNGSK
jgi:hypothetical protein